MSDFDLVLANGLIYDGTGAEPTRADLGIAGDRIAAVGAKLAGRQRVDCAGLALAPGFIDTHSHSDLQAMANPALEPKVRQGITLELFGQDGISVAPVNAADVPTRRKQLAGLNTNPDLDWAWRSVKDYLDALDRARPALDAAYLVPHGAVRETVMGLEDRRVTADELGRMKELLARSLDEGAFGLSTGLIYPPCCYSDTNELVELCGVAASRRTPIVVHLRSESDRLVEALEEMFEVGKRSGVHVHVSHFKIAGRNNWGKVGRILETVEVAKRAGVKVSADQYPYIAGSTMLGAILPPWVHSGGSDAAIKRLGDADDRKRMRAQMLDPNDCDWDNFWKWSGPEGIIVADVPSGRRPELVGKNLKVAAEAAKQDPLEFALDLLRDERMGVAMVSFSQSEDVVEKLMQQPYVNICTDGLLGGRPHPRAFGSYPRVLGRFAREKRSFSLAEAVRKMTGLPADTFGFNDHGYLKAGKRANVVAFDAEKVLDKATFEEPVQFPAGIEHVVVGGVFTVRQSRMTGDRAGRVVRRAR